MDRASDTESVSGIRSPTHFFIKVLSLRWLGDVQKMPEEKDV
jgi:hypothetical protein